MTEMTLPRLAGSRSAARRLIEKYLPADLSDTLVAVDCRDLKSAPPSFADEMVKVILGDRHASALVVHRASEEFNGYVKAAAGDHGVSDRVTIDA